MRKFRRPISLVVRARERRGPQRSNVGTSGETRKRGRPVNQELVTRPATFVTRAQRDAAASSHACSGDSGCGRQRALAAPRAARSPPGPQSAYLPLLARFPCPFFGGLLPRRFSRSSFTLRLRGRRWRLSERAFRPASARRARAHAPLLQRVFVQRVRPRHVCRVVRCDTLANERLVQHLTAAPLPSAQHVAEDARSRLRNLAQRRRACWRARHGRWARTGAHSRCLELGCTAGKDATLQHVSASQVAPIRSAGGA